jgi:protein tyrosine/serine phosphatase
MAAGTLAAMLTSPILTLAVGLAVATALILIWKYVLRYRLFPKRWGAVEKGSIYRSGQLHRSLVHRVLRDHGIEVIVNMNRRRPNKPDHAAEIEAAEALGIEQHWFSMNGDGTGDPENYALAVHQLHLSVQDNRRALVHCTAGAQRTGVTIALYRMLYMDWPAEQAVAEMASYGFDPKGDVALLRYVDEHLPVIAERLCVLGSLQQLPEPLPRVSS